MNLPNKLSILRIIMVPVFVVFYFIRESWTTYLALAIFILASITDFLDGYIARKYNLVTDLGKLLDPIADKILVCAALFCVAVSNPFRFSFLENQDFVWSFSPHMQNGQIILAVCGIIILSRELLIDAVRMISASNGTVVQANIYGKIKTVLLNVSLPILFVMEGLARNIDLLTMVSAPTKIQEIQDAYEVFSVFAVILFGSAIVMTIISGIVYLVQNKKVFESK